MTDETTPEAVSAPTGLATAGTALWSSVTGRYDLDAHEGALLLQAARTADRLDALAAVLDREGVTLGTGAVHPALVEARQQGLTLARLVAALRLPEDDAEGLHRPQRRGAPRGAYGPRAVA